MQFAKQFLFESLSLNSSLSKYQLLAIEHSTDSGCVGKTSRWETVFAKVDAGLGAKVPFQ